MLPALRYRAFVVGKRTECIFLNVYSCGFYVGFLVRLITHAYLRRGLCSAKSMASFYFIFIAGDSCHATGRKAYSAGFTPSD